MALYKSIKQIDGVTTNYHRILYITIMTNHHNSIAVCSYVDGEMRDSEKTGSVMQPYIQGVTYELPYDPNMTTVSAYEYLKTLPQFEGAIDV